MHKRAIAIYLEVTSLKSVSSKKLHCDIGISQPTAWLMRTACAMAASVYKRATGSPARSRWTRPKWAAPLNQLDILFGDRLWR